VELPIGLTQEITRVSSVIVGLGTAPLLNHHLEIVTTKLSVSKRVAAINFNFLLPNGFLRRCGGVFDSSAHVALSNIYFYKL
jgi:hypothetical protein